MEAAMSAEIGNPVYPNHQVLWVTIPGGDGKPFPEDALI